MFSVIFPFSIKVVFLHSILSFQHQLTPQPLAQHGFPRPHPRYFSSWLSFLIASSSCHFPLGPHTCWAPLINPVFYSLRLSPSALLQLINKPRKQRGPVDLLVIMSTLFLLREPRDAWDKFRVTAGNAKEMGHRKTQHEALGPVHVYNFLCKH